MWRAKRKKGRAGALVAASILLIAGDLLYRMMLLSGGLNALPLTLVGAGGSGWSYPISTGVSSQSTFMSQVSYLPNAMEWAVVLLPVGIALLLLVLVRLLAAKSNGKRAGGADDAPKVA